MILSERTLLTLCTTHPQDPSWLLFDEDEMLISLLPSSPCRPEGEPEEVAADGVMLGFNSDLSYLVCPWGPDPGGPLVNGSLHKDRIFVKDAKTRKLLLKFAHQRCVQRRSTVYCRMLSIRPFESSSNCRKHCFDRRLTFKRPAVREGRPGTPLDQREVYRLDLCKRFLLSQVCVPTRQS